MSALRAAGTWRRYAAWSLDAACVAALALPWAWPRMQVAAHALAAAFAELSERLAQRLGDALETGAAPAALAPALLADPALHVAAARAQAALGGLLLAPLGAYALLALAWHAGFQAGRWQASPAQRALGLWVARPDGARAGWLRLAARQLVAGLSWASLNLGHALALLPPHRTLHDLVTGTAVFDATGGARLPPWARAWIALQALGLLLGGAWLLARYLAWLQAIARA